MSACTIVDGCHALHIKGLEVINPIPWLGPSKQFVGGLPSVLVSREVVSDGRLAEQLKAVLADCARQVSKIRKPFASEHDGSAR